MNKASIRMEAGNTHRVMVQNVDARNLSRTFGSPVPMEPADLSTLVLAEGRAVLLTLGEAMPVTPSSLGRVGKQEPGTQHPGALSKHDVLQNADGVLQTTENMAPLTPEPEQPVPRKKRKR